MKIFLLILVLLSAFSDILCQNVSPEEENWMSDRYPDEVSDFSLTFMPLTEVMEYRSDISCNLIYKMNTII